MRTHAEAGRSNPFLSPYPPALLVGSTRRRPGRLGLVAIAAGAVVAVFITLWLGRSAGAGRVGGSRATLLHFVSFHIRIRGRHGVRAPARGGETSFKKEIEELRRMLE